MEYKSELIDFEEENRNSQERIKESLNVKIEVEGVNRRMVEYNEENVKKACDSLGKDLDEFWNEELPEDHPWHKLFEKLSSL